MFNLTHDESSAVDLGCVSTGPDEYEITFRFNADDEPDLNIVLLLDHDELQTLVRYLDTALTANTLRNM